MENPSLKVVSPPPTPFLVHPRTRRGFNRPPGAGAFDTSVFIHFTLRDKNTWQLLGEGGRPQGCRGHCCVAVIQLSQTILAIRCTAVSCSCDCFSPCKAQIRICDGCGHGWVSHENHFCQHLIYRNKDKNKVFLLR
ncbi:hypothetical protein CDAR_261761 [Caerostris darwini]|uniref:Uncharacterized protein n=1 Tax=Caerostris darwini TaxID=1538125 RepID=A0AAV4V2S8_9ARAC|nr:hypothetical protein CDAR_261761 [Caerostris darwini]